jgi:hypothetical protein
MGIKKVDKLNLSDKLKNKGGLCFFLGYPENHPKLNLKHKIQSERPIITRDAKWLNKIFGEHYEKAVRLN